MSVSDDCYDEDSEDYVPGSADDPRWWTKEIQIERRIADAERRHNQREFDENDELDGVLRWPGRGGCQDD